MNMQSVIENKLRETFNPQHLNIENESHLHGGPATESHFNITVVADAFTTQSLVKRHQGIYKLLSAELQGEVHALALHTYTPDEWESRHQLAPKSPDCKGGSNAG